MDQQQSEYPELKNKSEVIQIEQSIISSNKWQQQLHYRYTIEITNVENVSEFKLVTKSLYL